MRFFIALLLLMVSASAQLTVGKILEQGLKQAVAGLTPIPEKDKIALLDATAELLAKHITFRPDGSASSYYTMSVRQPVEWQKFTITHITAQAINEADRLNGITKRYIVIFGCDAHRSWDTKASTWGKWYAIGNVTFPSAISFEWKNGAWTTDESTQLKHFILGSGPSILKPKTNSKSDGLPPGMTLSPSK
jgi:hypothetical protein